MNTNNEKVLGIANGEIKVTYGKNFDFVSWKDASGESHKIAFKKEKLIMNKAYLKERLEHLVRRIEIFPLRQCMESLQWLAEQEYEAEEYKERPTGDTVYMKCRECGKEGHYEFHGYIGRCPCGSHDVMD